MPIFTLTMVAITTLLFFSHDLTSLCVYEREFIKEGEFWRIFSAHFVHFSFVHYILSNMAFLIVGVAVEQKKDSNFGWLLFFMAWSIGLGLLCFEPNMLYYGGLSGMVHGLLYYRALLGLKEHQPYRSMSQMVLLLLPLKVCFEFYEQSSLLSSFSKQTFQVVPLSHLLGMVTAVLFFIVIQYKKSKKVDELIL